MHFLLDHSFQLQYEHCKSFRDIWLVDKAVLVIRAHTQVVHINRRFSLTLNCIDLWLQQAIVAARSKHVNLLNVTSFGTIP